jgi:hypothetical protein
MRVKASGIGSMVGLLFVLWATIVLGSSSAARLQSQTSTIRVRMVGANNGQDVTNGGVSGKGRFTSTGAIVDAGTVVAYRTVKGNLDIGRAVITLRFVTRGKKGAITYLVKVKIEPATTTSTWTIASGTKAYKGLHGSGRERENAEHTVVTLTGTVSR